MDDHSADRVVPGSLVYDTRLHRTGDVTSIAGDWAELEPNPEMAGFLPWRAEMRHLRPASYAETMGARVAAAKDRQQP